MDDHKRFSVEPGIKVRSAKLIRHSKTIGAAASCGRVIIFSTAGAGG
jgi:hypothetical protein